MLDLAEGAKVVCHMSTTAAGANGDWINMENMHAIWVLATFEGTSGPVLHTQVAEDYAGTSSSSETAAIQLWTNYNTTTLDRWTKSTALFATFDDTNEGAVLMRFDPASVAASSNTHMSVAYSSKVGPLSITYIAEPRYAGYQQTIATTSST
jgi:hypothetical protein